MEGTQNGGMDGQPSNPPDHIDAADILDADPTLLKTLSDSLGTDNRVTPDQPEPPSGGFLSDLWDHVKQRVSDNFDIHKLAESFSAGYHASDSLRKNAGLVGVAKSVARGAAEAADNLSNAVVSPMAGLQQGTHLYRTDLSPEKKAQLQQADHTGFIKWWEQGSQNVNPLQFGQDRINKALGPAQGGLNGFIEGATQFTLGELLAKHVGITGGGALGHMARGFFADYTMFDPHAERLSNLVQAGPSWMQNPVTNFLASKEDDSDALGRLKQGLEGLMIGASIDKFLGGLKIAKARFLQRAGKITNDEADRLIREGAQDIAGADTKDRPDEAVTVTAEPEGTFAVHPKAEQVTGTLGDLAGSGFFTKPEQGVELPHNSPAGKIPTVEAVKQAIAKVGRDEFRRLADEEIAKRGAQGNPDASKAAIEETARRIAASADPAPQGPVIRFPSRAEAENAAASINYAYKNEKTAKGVFTGETTQAFKAVWAAYGEGKDPRAAAQLLEQYGVNVNYVQSPEEVVNVIKALGDVAPEASTVARDKPRTFADIAADAEGLFGDRNGDAVVAHFAQVMGRTDRLDSDMYAMRVWMWHHAEHVRKLAALANAQPTNAVATDELAKALDTMLELHAYLTGSTANVARTLGAHRMPVGGMIGDVLASAGKDAAEGADNELQAEADALGAEVTTAADDTGSGGAKQPKAKKPETPEQAPHRAPPVRKATAGLSRPQVRALANQVFLANGDPAEILAAIRAPRNRPKNIPVRKWYDYVNSYRMEAMLSGPLTQVTNALNNAIVMFQRPLEYYWAGVPTFWRKDGPEMRQMGADMLGGMWENARESWNATKKAFLSGDNVIDPGNEHTGYSMPSWQDATFLQKIVHAPSRFLMSTDEFFKQMSYRMNVRAQILRQAREAGVTDAEGLARRLKDQMEFATDAEGRATNPLALQYARVNTFSNPLEYGMGKWLQSGVQKHPFLRLVFPFVRTPVNIFRYTWERTPLLNFANKAFREDWAAGGERRALAQAKLEGGALFWTTASLLALSGNLTGRGPGDPKLRQQMKDAGTFVPYSVKVPGTNKWVSYRRGDPVFTALGLVADLAQASGEMTHDTFTEHASALVAAVASNITSKTFMQGATNFFDAMSSGRGDVVENVLESTAGSFVPNILRQASPDATIHETRTMVDELLNRLPGWQWGDTKFGASRLEPHRNLFGEPVLRPPGYFNRTLNPFTVTGKVPDVDVANTLLKLGKSFSMPSQTYGLIDLTDRALFGKDRHGQSPYDRMLELMSRPVDGRPSLREALTKLVTSDAWKALPDVDADGPGGEKWKLANSLVQSYHAMALAQVMSEYPSLRTAMKQNAEMQAEGAARGAVGLQDVLKKYGTDLFVKPRKGQ